jgi:hypothetical protein
MLGINISRLKQVITHFMVKKLAYKKERNNPEQNNGNKEEM